MALSRSALSFLATIHRGLRVVTANQSQCFARQFSISSIQNQRFVPFAVARYSGIFQGPSHNSHSKINFPKKLLVMPPKIISQQIFKRDITVVSRLGKRKSCKAVAKRFRRVKGGYLKRWRSGMVKKQRKKSSWRRFRLRGSVLVKSKTHLKVLNKMLYKY